jgi:hypothetical protein
MLAADTTDLHRETRDYDLNERANIKARLGVAALLVELAEARGLGWTDIASTVGVSVSAVRKWRTGGDCAPENRLKLAKLAAILDFLEDALVVDPAGFLLMRMRDDITLRHIDVVRAGRADLILDLATHRRTAIDVLNEFDPDWRQTFRSTHEITVDAEGERALQRRRAE